jgi:hypothetical protein
VQAWPLASAWASSRRPLIATAHSAVAFGSSVNSVFPVKSVSR